MVAAGQGAKQSRRGVWRLSGLPQPRRTCSVAAPFVSVGAEDEQAHNDFNVRPLH